MDQGHIEEQIIKQAVRSGLPIPDRIQNAPSILPGLELYYIGFLDLTSTRSLGGFGVGPIPWLAIQKYCEVLELDDDQTAAMHHHVAEMDKAYIKHLQKKNK
ncbi:MAG: hypothetical protein Unbinned200contig1000_19 [Prokaryotic dsDNA virus sp.]|jgi:hypothetical protein|nr:hypothetical protein [Flavobacteriaceae bacterium]QDP65279.1 MAG: hypothetical protein Unbinned200contig1000_19 [Prokaryotic dsDNA virus sp.]|tara:strand:+ start:25979 stop:26284 length:306 start_codon:yes stop_codon:yes gene_type:complete